MENVKITYCQSLPTGMGACTTIEMSIQDFMMKWETLFDGWYDERANPVKGVDAVVKSCIIDGVELVGNAINRKPFVKFFDALAYIESHLYFPDSILKRLARFGIEFRRDILDLVPKLVYMAKNEHVRAEISTGPDHSIKIIRDCDNYIIFDDRAYGMNEAIMRPEDILSKAVSVATLLDDAIEAGAKILSEYERY